MLRHREIAAVAAAAIMAAAGGAAIMAAAGDMAGHGADMAAATDVGA